MTLYVHSCCTQFYRCHFRSNFLLQLIRILRIIKLIPDSQIPRITSKHYDQLKLNSIFFLFVFACKIEIIQLDISWRKHKNVMALSSYII